MRTCRKRFQPKEDSEFGVNQMFKDNKAIYCFDCNRDHTRKLREQVRVLLRTTKVKVSYSVLGMK